MQRFLSHKKAVQEEFEQRVDETRRLLTVVSRQEYYLEHPQTSPAALGQRADNVISMAQQLLLSSSSPAAAPVSPFGGFFREGHFPLPLMKHPLLQLLPLLGQVKVVVPQYLTIYLELCNFLEFGTCLVCAVNCYFTHVLLN